VRISGAAPQVVEIIGHAGFDAAFIGSEQGVGLREAWRPMMRGRGQAARHLAGYFRPSSFTARSR